MKKSILPVIPAIVLFLLLSHPTLSFEGAKTGLLLWFNVVLPTLLPFMLCSSLLVAWGGVPLLTRPLRPFFRLFHLSENGSYALISGLLCGYPMGAKTTADFLRQNVLTKKEGKLLLAMSGCPSPMFLAGYIRTHLDSSIPFVLVAVAIYLPVFFIGLLARLAYRDRSTAGGRKETSAYSYHDTPSRIKEPSPPFDEILMSSLEIMVKIGGYIMLYSILACFIQSSFCIPVSVKPFFLGFVEMTTGIEGISQAMKGLPAAAAITASAAFGGLSGVSQTNTVTKNAGLSIRHYVLWKLLHASLSSATLILLSSL